MGRPWLCDKEEVMAVRPDPKTSTKVADGDQLHRTNRRLKAVVVALAVLLVAVSGWLAAELTSDPTASDEQGTFPTGVFAGERNPSHVFEFFEDGTFTYVEGDYTEGDPDVSGVYGVRGDLYTEMLHDYAGYQKVPATYRWEFDGERLKFELVGEDVLSGREQTMTNQYYIRSS